MLRTNLDHLETQDAMTKALNENENVMICCGRMGPMCLPVYAIMEDVKSHYPHVRFFDQEFEGMAATYIRDLSECSSFMGLPFSVYFKNGKVVAATGGIQSREKVVSILNREFGKPV